MHIRAGKVCREKSIICENEDVRTLIPTTCQSRCNRLRVEELDLDAKSCSKWPLEAEELQALLKQNTVQSSIAFDTLKKMKRKKVDSCELNENDKKKESSHSLRRLRNRKVSHLYTKSFSVIKD